MTDDHPPILPAAILFDMDGTLTEPLLDFPAIKAELGIGARPILEAMAQMSGGELSRAQQILDRHETQAAERSTLNRGCHELLDWLSHRQIAVALVTRNSLRCTRIVLERHRLKFDVQVTREDPPFKPDPAPLRLACQRVGLNPASVWMVGDGRYDMEASSAAKIYSVWISHGRSRDFACVPCDQVNDLPALQAKLERVIACYRLGASAV